MASIQSGSIPADLIRDNALFPSVHRTADIILREHPDFIQPLIDRWLGVTREYGKI